MNRTEHELELMRLYLEGFASLEETKELESLIVKDASVRQDFLRYTHLDSALAGVRRSQPKVVATRRSGWFSWRPLTAAAAGILLGMFCTSVVFGYVGPRVLEKVKTVFAEGFESGVMETRVGLPREVGHWSGDKADVVSSTSQVKAHGGAKMLRFLSATYSGENSPRSHWSDVYRIVDVRGLAGAGSTMARVSASFARGTADTEAQFSCSVDAMAIEQDLSELPLRLDLTWLRHHSSAAGLRKVALSPAQEWQQVSVEMPITPETRYIILHLAVVQDRPALESGVVHFPGHFMDDVKVVLVTRP
jgi:hypothetical protein